MALTEDEIDFLGELVSEYLEKNQDMSQAQEKQYRTLRHKLEDMYEEAVR